MERSSTPTRQHFHRADSFIHDICQNKTVGREPDSTIRVEVVIGSGQRQLVDIGSHFDFCDRGSSVWCSRMLRIMSIRACQGAETARIPD